MDPPAPLPSGTVTFLFTDIEGSTKLWEQHPQAMEAALARHDALAEALFQEHAGTLVKSRGEGDSLFAVFARAADAVAAACALQQALCREPWPTETPLRVRMALHTGDAAVREGDYFGAAVNRCARLRAIAHGGQILLAAATQEVVQESLPPGASLRDLGTHRLRDLQRPERVFELLHPHLPADFPPLASLDALPNNLPLQVTNFIGREREITEVKRLLEGTRLLTVTGAGGTGKTRLALQAAAELLPEYADGVWLVELAPLADPALVPQTVASVLGVKAQPGTPLTQTLVEALEPKTLLVLLDNCEHLLAACAALAEALLRSCPGVRLLATSREGLNIPGETPYRLRSLAAPDPHHLPPTPERLIEYEAVHLFLDRAATVAPAFTLTDANVPAVARVCCRLDGIPLAIELAAARVKVMSVEKVNQLLDDRFRLLTGGSRTALPRQQTLRALIDWSYDLLSEPERRLLCRLAVFAGGWTLEAASAVGSGEPIEEWEVLDLLTALVEKSLVVYEEQEERYRLLETVRQYARDRLLESGEGEAVRRRHRDYFLTLAEEESLKERGPEQIEALDRFEREHENLRAALDWCAAEVEGAQASMRLAGALARFWQIRGYLTEGRERLAAALSREGASEDTPARAAALQGAAMLALNQGDRAAVRALYEESLRLWRALGETRQIARALLNLGVDYAQRGDRESARSFYEESLELFRQIGGDLREGWVLAMMGGLAFQSGELALARSYAEESLVLHRQWGFPQGIAHSLSGLAHVARKEGDAAQARRLYQESLAVSEQLGDKIMIAGRLLNLGTIVAEEGDSGSAHSCFRQSLIHYQEIGNKGGIADALLAIVWLEHSHGCAPKPGGAQRAAHLLGVVKRLRDAHGWAWGPVPRPYQQQEYDHLDREVRSELGEEAFVAAWEEGRAMTLHQALAYALEGSGDA